MKIERGKGRLDRYAATGKSYLKGVSKGEKSSFEQELSYHRDRTLQLQEILTEMDRVNDRLSKNLNINDLMLYKKLVKNFLQEACNQAYAVKQQRGRNRRGRTLLVTIDTINTEVEKLISDFVSKAKEPVEILETMDKIRGMLVDLMV
ncbi:MAG: DUF327 family protein [Syntrophomonadaceae bacterium]|jgi:uncharacterized protein YaaR (DUF327 family)